jgi:molybdopterin-guanine dinucleotide biosynthesis protein A
MDQIGRAGFILAGGNSSRMGRDKAFLPAGGRTLIEQIADYVEQATGNVTLIGPRERYAGLGYPVVSDMLPGMGPLGGLYTALRTTSSRWNLILACDMPRLTADFLRGLLQAAENCGKDCLVPVTSDGAHPLCAAYHRDLLPRAESALSAGQLKMQAFVRALDTEYWPVDDPDLLRNVNTPDEFAAEIR